MLFDLIRRRGCVFPTSVSRKEEKSCFDWPSSITFPPLSFNSCLKHSKLHKHSISFHKLASVSEQQSHCEEVKNHRHTPQLLVTQPKRTKDAFFESTQKEIHGLKARPFNVILGSVPPCHPQSRLLLIFFIFGCLVQNI